MAFPTTYMRLGHIHLHFFTIRRNLNSPLENSRDGSAHGGIQPQMFAGICTCNSRHRAGLAQIRRPVLPSGFQQAAFLYVSTTEIVTIKVWALCARRSFHVLIISVALYSGRWMNTNLTIFNYGCNNDRIIGINDERAAGPITAATRLGISLNRDRTYPECFPKQSGGSMLTLE